MYFRENNGVILKRKKKNDFEVKIFYFVVV